MTPRKSPATVTAEGIVGVSIVAGHIRTTDQPAHPRIGQQVVMGTGDLSMHITPDIARQWIDTLTPIATTEESK